MAQVNQRSKDAATFIGRETTFAVEPITMVRAFPVEGSFTAELEQSELENLEESVNLYDNKATVRGLKGGSVKMDFYGRVPSAILADTVVPVPHYLGTLLETALGAQASDEGAVVGALSAPATFDVSAGQGTRFEQGQWVGVEVGGTIEPARVSTIAIDTLSVYPAFSGIPASAGAVHNSYTYAPEPNHTSTLHIQHAKPATTGAGLQWSISGSTANISFDIKRNDLVKISLEGQAGSWQGPGNFGFVTSSASDTMSAPFAVRDAITLFQPNATTTRTSYCLISADVKINGGMEHIECLGNIEGKAGAFRKGQRIFAEATLKFRFDQDIDATNWTNQTLMSCVLMIPKGTGLTKRWLIVDMPSCRIVGKPKLSDENGMLYMEATVIATMDKVTTQSLIPTSMEQAPFRLAFI